MLHRSGLVIAAVPRPGQQLLKRRSERRRKELLNAAGQHPVHPLQGLRPRAVPELALPEGPLVLHAGGGDAGCMLLVLSAVTLVTVQFDIFRSQAAGLPRVLQLLQRPVAVGDAGA